MSKSRRARFAWARFRRCQSGATAVEFAFVGAPFLFLLLAIFEAGILLFADHAVTNGTADAARMIRTGQVQTQGMSAAQFKEQVCGGLSEFLDCSNKLYVDVRRFDAFEDVDMPAAVGDDGELSDEVTADASFDPGGPMEVVVVRVYYDWDLFVPGVSLLANLGGSRRLITAGAAFRNEPYGDQADG